MTYISDEDNFAVAIIQHHQRLEFTFHNLYVIIELVVVIMSLVVGFFFN
jgi:inorganic pyrophosphatase/exopolyphosphatase